MQASNDRKEYIDILRVLSTLAVITIHVTAHYFRKLPVSTMEWSAISAMNCLSRWAVPIFVMISGTLFLERDITIERIIKKYIFRITMAFCFWSFIYASWNLYLTGNIKGSIVLFLKGPRHFWYLFMMIGLYLIVPLIKNIVTSDKLMKYYMFLALLFSFVLPQILKMGEFMTSDINDVLLYVNQNINFHFAVGYTGYFVLGYYLANRDITKKYRKIIYVLGGIGFLLTIVVTETDSWIFQEPQDGAFDNLSINVLLESIGVYVFVKYELFRVLKNVSMIFKKIAKSCFGVYLVHALFLQVIFDVYQIDLLISNSLLACFLAWIYVVVCSYFASVLVNKIPALRGMVV